MITQKSKSLSARAPLRAFLGHFVPYQCKPLIYKHHMVLQEGSHYQWKTGIMVMLTGAYSRVPMSAKPEN